MRFWTKPHVPMLRLSMAPFLHLHNPPNVLIAQSLRPESTSKLIVISTNLFPLYSSVDFAGFWSVGTHSHSHILYDARATDFGIWDTACSTTFAFSAPTVSLVCGQREAESASLRQHAGRHIADGSHLWSRKTDRKQGRSCLFS